jgi:alkanesulfonate monooxygenase SsuD/methylene tetrahydromethanopterin reductase-like flavin-dependent oxidoreductase (luciferase family)
MSLPHRSPDAIDMNDVRIVAQRAEALGFRDLWVTENTLDHVMCFDPVVVLTYAAAVTSRIRLGASVVVLAIVTYVPWLSTYLPRLLLSR